MKKSSMTLPILNKKHSKSTLIIRRKVGKMAASLIILTLCVGAVVATGVPAAKYPAGVDPHLCPNYPKCDNVNLTAHSRGHHGVAPYAASSYATYGHHGAVFHGAGAKYPADVSPHACPNYPYCDNVAVAAQTLVNHGAVTPYAAPAYAAYGHHDAAVHGAGAKYPAGVDPNLCLNYPYCGPTPVHGVYGYSEAHGWTGVSHGFAGHGSVGTHAAPIWRHGLYSVHHGAGAQYPAGVKPHSCPNYPYCHH